jgi:hypothetical protein
MFTLQQAAFDAIVFMHSGTAAGAAKPMRTVALEACCPIGSASATLMMIQGTRYSISPQTGRIHGCSLLPLSAEYVRSERLATREKIIAGRL